LRRWDAGKANAGGDGEQTMNQEAWNCGHCWAVYRGELDECHKCDEPREFKLTRTTATLLFLSKRAVSGIVFFLGVFSVVLAIFVIPPHAGKYALLIGAALIASGVFIYRMKSLFLRVGVAVLCGPLLLLTLAAYLLLRMIP
jgi:hypothetical protein